jgi:hypothetical protein
MCKTPKRKSFFSIDNKYLKKLYMLCRTILSIFGQSIDSCAPCQCLFTKCQSPVFVANDVHVIFVLLRPIFPCNVCFHGKWGGGVGGGVRHLIGEVWKLYTVYVGLVCSVIFMTFRIEDVRFFRESLTRITDVVLK